MEQPKRKNIRLTTYDYSAPGAYFITVCTKDKKNLFWSDVGGSDGSAAGGRYSDLSEWQRSVCDADASAARRAPGTATGIDRPEDVPLNHNGQIVDQAIKSIPEHYPTITVDRYVIMPNHIHLLLQIHGGADGRSLIAPTISTVVRLMKSAASHEAGFALWQKGFYDHVIRSDADYLDCWQYIEGNPGRREEKHYET